jgi:hypothetical protein
MIKKLLIQAYFCFSCFLGCSQSADWSVMGQLPDELEENSGMVYFPPNQVTYINDSGNKPEILSTDTLGNLIQKFCLPGLTNKDWEELTRDGNGNLYIGDFGNNSNSRRDLVIYKVEASKVLIGDDSFDLGEIHFQYEDQQNFPPNRRRRNYDTEAMIHIGDSIYLFTKNRTRPFNGFTYCYRIPDTPGEYLATKVDSFSTGNGPKEAFWISGAAYRHNPRTLLLLGYNKLWMFYYFEGNKFFSGKHSVIYFNTFTQKEAIAFKTGNEVFLTDEKNSSDDGNLYKLILPELMQNNKSINDSTATHIHISDTKVSERLSVEIRAKGEVEVLWEAFSKNGQRLYSGKLGVTKLGKSTFEINVNEWKKGKYELHIITNGLPSIFKIKKKD